MSTPPDYGCEPRWLKTLSDPQLEPGALHLWRCAEDVPTSTITKLASALSSEERRRATQYRFEPDRRRFVLCRGILRDLLGRYLGCSPESVRLSRGEQGKPGLDPDHHRAASIEFNLSHTRGMCLIGFAKNRAVGVDVETVDPNRDWTSLARRFLHPNEWETISLLPVANQAAAFYSCWTCKEAYLKARGDGLSRALSSFEATLPAHASVGTIADPSSDSSERWWLSAVDVASDFAGAVATPHAPDRVQYFQFS